MESSTLGKYRDVMVEDGTTMRLVVARPPRAGRHPGIIVLQEAFGVNSHIREVTQRFAREGFLAVAPELFHRTAAGFETGYGDVSVVKPHMDALTVDGMSADIRAAHRWLVSEGEVDPARVAAVGYCLGGRAAFLANVVLPLAAAVSYYGGGVAAAGLLERVRELHAPHLFFWGGLDKHIPPEQHRAIDDALRAAGKPFVTVEFSDADHGFNCNERSQYQPDAAAQAWELTKAFLGRHLPKA
ncbi:MAG: dienelactone hydrolase family protein [Gemmatimonadetes bacterium]|nr:dienelactone hydrolase family protein [Gemmatimonadota bacterium]